MESKEPKLPKLFPKANLKPRNGNRRRSLYTQEDSLMCFNTHYKTSICLDEQEIDLTNVQAGYYLARDVSRIKFTECKKLLLNIPLVQLKDLTPKMPNLTYLGLIGCGFGRFYLKYHFFKTLEELDLTGNDFSKAESIIPAKNLPNLKKIHLTGNPICYDKTEQEKLNNLLNNIEVIY